MKSWCYPVCFTLFFWANCAVSRSVDLNINPDMVRLTYESMVKRNEFSDFGFMMFERKNPKTDYALQLGYNVKMNQIKVGVRGIYVSPGVYDVLAVGIGVQGEIKMSQAFGMSGHAYYAPKVTSALDANKYREFALSFNYYVIPPARLYIGYRNLQVRVTDNNRKFELDDDLHIGFELDF